MADEPTDQPEVDDAQPTGTVEISDNVVAKIAFEACRETDGVHALGGATSRALSNLRGGEHRTTGVSVDLRGDVVDLDINLVVAYGRSIPEVAQECRDTVRERVEAITGLTVQAINVIVSDIYFHEAAPADPGGHV